MPAARSLRVALSVLSAVAILAPIARAGDEPAAPKPPPKIEHAFLDGLVGSWDTVAKGMGQEAKGMARFRKAVGGTALVYETQRGAAATAFDGLGVLRLDDAAKVATMWWFDTRGMADVVVFRGPLTADGFDLDSEPGFSLHMKKTEAGAELKLNQGENVLSTTTFTKAAKGSEFDVSKAPKDELRSGMIGDWSLVGAWKVTGSDGKVIDAKYTGNSTFKWALRGAAMTHDYAIETPEGPATAFGVLRWPADGSKVSLWHFEDAKPAPLVVTGPVAGGVWNGSGDMDGFADGLRWTKKGAGYEMAYMKEGKAIGAETFTKKK